MPDPTIIVGSLNDEELKKSIDSLVKHVETQTQAMVTAFDKAVGQINEKVKSLGSTGASSGGVVDSSKLADSVSKLTEALGKVSEQERETTSRTERETNRRIESYDKEVMALKAAIRERIRATENTFITQPSRFGSDLVFYDKDILGSYQQAIDRATELYAAKMRNVEVTRREAEAQAQLNQELGNAKIPYANESGKGGVNDQAAASNAYLKSLREQEEALKRNEQAENELKRSHNALSASLKKLVADYDKMNAAERNSARGRDLIKKIQATERAIKDIQRQKNRPLRLEDIIAIQPKNLDEIAYKIQQLKAYMQGVDIEGNKSALTFKTIREEIAKLQKQQDGLMGSTRGLINQYGAFGRAISYIKNRLAFMLTVGASMNFAKEVYKIRGQYELLERSIGILFDSMSKGKQIFAELNAMAIKSPFTTMELGAAAKQLSAYNIAARDVVDTTRRLADMAAAVGVPIERLTYALGQVKAYGFLNSRDARMFSNAGIPLVQELANRYSELEGRLVSVADVYDRIKKHQISFEDVIGTINKMTDEGGKFFDFQAKAADTMVVQLANLRLEYNNMLNELGKENQAVITAPIKMLKYLLHHWKSLDNVIWSVIATMGLLKGFQIVLAGIFYETGKINTRFEVMTKKGVTAYAAIRNLAVALKNLVLSSTAWASLLSLAIFDVAFSAWEAHKATKAFHEELRAAAKEDISNIDEFLRTNKEIIGNAAKSKDGRESGKVWASIREEIMKSSIAADRFVGRLENIDDVSQRISEGVDFLGKIKEVDSVIAGLGDKAITVTQDWAKWWNLWAAPEGLAENVRDYAKSVKEQSRDIFQDQELMIRDLRPTIEDVFNIAKISGFDPDQERILFERTMKQIAIQQNLNVEQYRLMRINAEVEYAKKATGAAKEEFESRKALQETFFDWLFERQDAEVRKRLGNMTAQQIRQGEWVTEENKKWANEQAAAFSDQYNVAFDDLKKFVWDANTWSIYIPVRLGQEEEKSEFDILTEWDKKAQSADEKIKRLNERIDELRKKTNLTEEETKELSKADEEYYQAQKDLNEALAHGGRLKDKKSKGSQKDAVLEALKTEIDLIKKAQKAYDDLIKKGASADEAEITVFSAYSKTLTALNRNLQGFGLPTVKLPDIIGKNPQQMLKYFETLRDLLESKGLGNLERMKVVEVLIEELKVKAQEFNIEQVTKGLNNALSQVKDEYELAVALDADPELGKIFQGYFGLTDEDLAQLPKNYEGMIKRFQELIDKELQANPIGVSFDLKENMDKETFDAWVANSGRELDSEFIKKIEAIRKLIYDTQVKETKDQIAQWDKLLEKYAEYETKKRRIDEDYEKEKRLAQQRNASQEIMDAIERERKQRHAQLDFEEFQKSATWINAIGDLSTMSHKAIGILIDRLEEYKDKAKNLDPKQVRILTNALKKLHKEFRRDSPFRELADNLDAARERADSYKEELAELERQEGELASRELNEEELKQYDEIVEKIEKIKQEQKELGKVPVDAIAKFSQSMNQLAQTGIGNLASFFESIGDEKTANALKKVDTVLNSIGQWASMGGSVGGGWGALAGAVVGAGLGIVQALGDIISGNADITEQVEESEHQVSKLELAYKHLEHEVDKSYGTARIGATKLAAANKELQLAELRRQLHLEESRKKKNRDEDKIAELKGQIIDLEYEIKDTTEELVNDLLGMSSVGDAAESFMESFIEALRSGEDAMKGFNESIDDMIANMLKKMLATKILGPMLEEVWNQIQEEIEKRGADTAAQMAKLQFGISYGGMVDLKKEESILQGLKALGVSTEEKNNRYFATYEAVKKQLRDAGYEYAEAEYWAEQAAHHSLLNLFQERMKQVKEQYQNLSDIYDEETAVTLEDIQAYANSLNALKPEMEGYVDEIQGLIDQLGLMKDDVMDEKLSLLQQGLNSMTEDTANSLEAYLNSVSQQVYYQSDILTQIRDTVQSFEMDAQLGTLSQMLLQLQQSYQVQMSIQGILEGVLTPSGRAFNVELLS